MHVLREMIVEHLWINEPSRDPAWAQRASQFRRVGIEAVFERSTSATAHLLMYSTTSSSGVPAVK